MSHVAGYARYDDGSIRDYQRHAHQFIPGKNFPDTGAFGLWMMTLDELGALDDLRLQTRLHGIVAKEATISQMIFDIARRSNIAPASRGWRQATLSSVVRRVALVPSAIRRSG